MCVDGNGIALIASGWCDVVSASAKNKWDLLKITD